MPVSISLYDHTTKKLANKEIDLTAIKAMLLDDTAVFNAADTVLNDVAGVGHAKEVDGNGWPTGGKTLENVAVTTVNTNDAKLDADDVSQLATGGPIGPARKAVLYDDTALNDPPLAFIDFGQDETAGEDTDFKIVWNTNGIITFTYS